MVIDKPVDATFDPKVAANSLVTPVHYLGMWARNSDNPQGLIFPERVFKEIKKLLNGSVKSE